MLDTVRIKHFYRRPIEKDVLKQLGWKQLRDKKNLTWAFNLEDDKNMPRLTYIITPNFLFHLSAEVSLPRMLFGNNAILPKQKDVRRGLQIITDYVEEKSNRKFDAFTAVVRRVDYARDVRLSQSEVFNAIHSLSEKSLPRLNKMLFNDSTLYFQSKSRVICIYSKFSEVMSRNNSIADIAQKARGNLRFEYRYNHIRSINLLIKRANLLNNTATCLLNEETSNFVMSELLESLNFYETISNNRTILDILLSKFPTRKAMLLHGFLNTVKQHGEHFYKDKVFNISKDAYFRLMRDCKQAGVWKSNRTIE